MDIGIKLLPLGSIDVLALLSSGNFSWGGGGGGGGVDGYRGFYPFLLCR